mgnify:CR=1 FL=1
MVRALKALGAKAVYLDILFLEPASQEEDELLAEARTLIAEAEAPLADHQDIYHAGFFYDAVKEYAEGVLTAALLAGERLPLPSEIGVHSVPYLKGLGEAVGEQRRRMLDFLRSGRIEEAEATFVAMDAVLDLLTSLDYPDGMTAGLRRTTDVARSLIERSRSDLTTAVVQERLLARILERFPPLDEQAHTRGTELEARPRAV